MIDIKTKKELEIMKTGGHMLAEVLNDVMNAIKPGVTELELDQLAEKLIRQKGGEPGFKKVRGYHHSICMSTNDVVVHGIPGGYVIKEGDVVGVDCGVYYKGFHTDMAETILVSSQKSKVKSQKNVEKFLEVGKQAHEVGVKVAVIGNRVGHISKAIQDIVERESGYSVVRSLIGHGVGRALHEDPEVPGYLVGRIEKTPLLQEGMTIAIEVIYNMGSKDVVLDHDGWTIRTKDGSLAGLIERSIAITKDGPIVLTS
ncbi:MAG TPA: type I methionyl aminopeptidase [Candidatus Limnocylindrales bacterium]|nr:type I methionyl aminopeptidase [Candidatus Limnocylindrales bacterium]